MASVAIVGGGPAGSSVALHLLRQGVDPADLVVFDKAKFPRPKLCGGALTWRGTRALEELIGRPAGGGRTISLEFRCALGRFPVRERGEQWLYDRAALDDQLLRAVIGAGVEVRQETAVTSVEGLDGGWRVRWRGGTQRFDWVVGADGARGVVGRSVELHGGFVGRLVEAVYTPVDEAPDDSVLYFDFDPIGDGIPGYAWIFPYPKPGERGLWKLGIMDGRGVTTGRVLRQWTDAFAERNGFRRLDAKIAGWPERYFDPRARAHLPGLILTGEAWGVDPLLGEGIAPALEMGRYAAAQLKRALDQGVRRIEAYEAGFRATEEGKNLVFQGRLAKLLYGKGSHRWLRVLFGHEYMKELAAQGTQAYGRLQQHTWKLAGSYLRQVLRGGIPPNRPIPSTMGPQLETSAP